MALAAMAAPSMVFAQSAATDINWVLIPYGARPAGMGKAFAAEATGVEAVHWNPAGLATLDERSVIFSHMDGVSDTQVEYLTVAFPNRDWGNVAVTLFLEHLGGDPILETDNVGNVLGTLAVWNHISGVGYATPVTESIDFGVNLKFLFSKLADVLAYSTAFDAGLTWRVSDQLALAAVLRNQGPKLQYIDHYQADPIAGRLVLGSRYTLLEDEVNRMIVTADVYQPTSEWSNDINGYVGVEFNYLDMVSIRGGGLYEPDYGRTGGTSYTYGAGLQWNEIRFDFALVSDNDLEDKRIFSIVADF